MHWFVIGISEICLDKAVSPITDRADIRTGANKERRGVSVWK